MYLSIINKVQDFPPLNLPFLFNADHFLNNLQLFTCVSMI